MSADDNTTTVLRFDLHQYRRLHNIIERHQAYPYLRNFDCIVVPTWVVPALLRVPGTRIHGGWIDMDEPAVITEVPREARKFA